MKERKERAVSHDTRRSEDVERQRTKLAEATGIGESTAGRALAIAHKRPDLLDQVRHLSALPVNFPTPFSVFHLRSGVYTLRGYTALTRHTLPHTRNEEAMENGFGMNQKLVREVARLRKELLEVEEARQCAMDTIKYLETLHKKNGTDPLLRLL